MKQGRPGKLIAVELEGGPCDGQRTWVPDFAEKLFFPNTTEPLELKPAIPGEPLPNPRGPLQIYLRTSDITADGLPIWRHAGESDPPGG